MERAGFVVPTRSRRSSQQRHGRVATFAGHNLTSEEDIARARGISRLSAQQEKAGWLKLTTVVSTPKSCAPCRRPHGARSTEPRRGAFSRPPSPDMLGGRQTSRIAPASAFDPRRIMEYLIGKAERTAAVIKSAISKVFGICDADEGIIHIDHNVRQSKENFLKLHEAGHLELPTHRKVFRIFQDCEKTLDPEIARSLRSERPEQLLRDLSSFRATVIATWPRTIALELKTPMKLAGKFGASVYASCREFARTHRRACAVYVSLSQSLIAPSWDSRAEVRRIEVSPSSAQQFGRPSDTVITSRHSLGRVLADRPPYDQGDTALHH